MNFHLLAADIIRRVQHSRDSAINLETVVANLIRDEHHRAIMLERGVRLDMMHESDRRRETADEPNKKPSL